MPLRAHPPTGRRRAPSPRALPLRRRGCAQAVGSAQLELLCVVVAADGQALLAKRTLAHAAVSALHGRVSALRHAIAERKACSGPGGTAGAGAVPPALVGVPLSEEEAPAFAELIREAEELLEPSGRLRAGDDGGPPALPALGEVVGVLEQILDAEHGVLDMHAPTAAWLHALMSTEPAADAVIDS